MKYINIFLVLILAFFTVQTMAQKCAPDNRFSNVEFFSSTQIDSLKNVTYGSAINMAGKSQELTMDFYFPNNELDPMKKRPFIMLIHGGGYINGKKEYMRLHAKEFAKRGFAVATINYRLGVNEEIDQGIKKAVYRAQQDASAALRYVVANAKRLRIDKSWIFLGGSSAGAMTSLLTSYADQEEWSLISSTMESSLGTLDRSGNKLNRYFTIRGIYNHVGAVHPFVLDQEELIPTISFHGDLDGIESGSGGLGSGAIHTMLNQAGVCNDFTIVPGGTHNIYNSYQGILFRINRVSCFFKSVICGTCTSFKATKTVPANCAN